MTSVLRVQDLLFVPSLFVVASHVDIRRSFAPERQIQSLRLNTTRKRREINQLNYLVTFFLSKISIISSCCIGNVTVMVRYNPLSALRNIDLDNLKGIRRVMNTLAWGEFAKKKNRLLLSSWTRSLHYIVSFLMSI